jgi:hypothetical protein
VAEQLGLDPVPTDVDLAGLLGGNAAAAFGLEVTV